jgi:hypothetical protein
MGGEVIVAADVAAVPEPTTIAGLIVAGFGMGIFKRRQARKIS